MDTGLAGKVVIVTGATANIGRGIALVVRRGRSARRRRGTGRRRWRRGRRAGAGARCGRCRLAGRRRDRRGGRGGRRVGGDRPVRADRRADQQRRRQRRRHPVRVLDAGPVACRRRPQPHEHALLHPRRPGAHAGGRARAHHQHRLDVRPDRRSEPGRVLRGQGRDPRVHAGPRPRARRHRHHGQRDRAVQHPQRRSDRGDQLGQPVPPRARALRPPDERGSGAAQVGGPQDGAGPPVRPPVGDRCRRRLPRCPTRPPSSPVRCTRSTAG